MTDRLFLFSSQAQKKKNFAYFLIAAVLLSFFGLGAVSFFCMQSSMHFLGYCLLSLDIFGLFLGMNQIMSYAKKLHRSYHRIESLESYLIQLPTFSCSFDDLASLWNIPLSQLESTLQELEQTGWMLFFEVDFSAQTVHRIPDMEEQTKREQPKQNEAERCATPMLYQLKCLRMPVGKPYLQTRKKELLSDIEALLKSTRTDEADIAPTVQFCSRFLPMGISMLEKAAVLLPEERETEQKLLEALELLHQASRKQLIRLQENNRIEAEAEATALEHLLCADGLLSGKKD